MSLNLRHDALKCQKSGDQDCRAHLQICTSNCNLSQDMNYYLVRRKAMHMGPPCNLHRWAQKVSIVMNCQFKTPSPVYLYIEKFHRVLMLSLRMSHISLFSCIFNDWMKLDTWHSHFQVDTGHYQIIEVDTRHSDPPSWALTLSLFRIWVIWLTSDFYWSEMSLPVLKRRMRCAFMKQSSKVPAICFIQLYFVHYFYKAGLL